jgi:hypothetical protein
VPSSSLLVDSNDLSFWTTTNCNFTATDYHLGQSNYPSTSKTSRTDTTRRILRSSTSPNCRKPSCRNRSSRIISWKPT